MGEVDTPLLYNYKFIDSWLEYSLVERLKSSGNKFAMKKLYSLIILVFISLSLFSSPDKVRMISIGIDYTNTPDEDMVLYGTMNDALEMTAAVKNVMEAKGVEYESVLMLQEGEGDYYIEIIVPGEELLIPVEEILLNLNTDSFDEEEYELDDGFYLVRDRVKDAETLEAVYEAVTALDSDIIFDFFDIKDTPTYPSDENIINQVLLSADLDYDDLLIVYYSGHGGSDDAFTSLDMAELLTPYYQDGSLDEDTVNAVLDLNTITEDTVMDRLGKYDVDEDIIYSILDDMEKSDDSYKTGILATAYTADNYYTDSSSLEMYVLYAALSLLKCDSVLIIDACYSGYAADNLSDYLDESDYDHSVNIEVMSASSMDETSEEYAIENEDGEWESHGAFTLEVLSHLGWKHSSSKKSVIEVPFYTIDDEGDVVELTSGREVDGYTSFIPERQTASEFFSSLLENWDNAEQHPQDGESTYLLYFIP